MRLDEGRWVGGVAAGLGRYFDVDPLVYRIAFAALALVGGTGLLLYAAAWAVMPAESEQDSVAVRVLRRHRERPWLVLGVGLLGFCAVLALSEVEFWPGVGNVWLAALLAGAALLWWNLAQREAPPAAAADRAGASAQPPSRPAAPRKPSLLAPALGALLAAAGTFGLLAVLDVYEVDLALALAAAVAILGAAIAIGAFAGYRVAALVPVGLLLLTAFGAAAALPVSLSSGIGDKDERPLALSELERSYEFGIGDYEVDLSRVQLPDGVTRVDVSLGIGYLRVVVPEDAAVEIDARAGAGKIVVPGAADDGFGAGERIRLDAPAGDAPLLVLDADVGFGMVDVDRG